VRELPPEVPEGDEGTKERRGVPLEERSQLQVPQEGKIVVGEVLPPQIEVDGNVLTGDGSLATWNLESSL